MIPKLTDILLENWNLLSENDRESALLAKYVDNDLMDRSAFDRIWKADPTSNNAYTQWLLNQFIKNVGKKPKDRLGSERQEYIRKNRIFFEDLDTVSESLNVFHRLKNRYPKRDINQYSTSDLVADTIEVQDKADAKDKEKLQRSPGDMRFSGDANKYPELQIGKVKGFTVWKIPQVAIGSEQFEKMANVAADLGQDTSWCTRTGCSGYFRNYSGKDPLFIFIGNGTKYQFHFADNQFKNRADGSMPEGELKDAFLQFLEDEEGRVTKEKDVTKNKIGQFITPEGTLPLYKLGKDTVYTNLNGEEVFYDTATKSIKDKSGRNKKASFLMKHPGMDFLKAIYYQNKKEGKSGKENIPGVYRLLLDLDVPDKGPDYWWTIPGGLNIPGSDLTKLPEGLHIEGDLDITGSKIKELPKRLKVDGEIYK